MPRCCQLLGFFGFLLVLWPDPVPALSETFGRDEFQFAIEFIIVGSPQNAGDPSGQPRLVGRVPYVYHMASTEVSRRMVEYANAQSNIGLTLASLDVVAGGPRPEMPATGISWNEAARFVNWLNVDQGFYPAYKFRRQVGDAGYHPNQSLSLWTVADDGFDPQNPFRNRLARYVLPSVDEWHKAAYFDPGTGSYLKYPTGSDFPPIAVSGSTSAGTAVYGQTYETGPADVGMAGGLSPFGMMAAGGNVFEWEETDFDGVNDSGLSTRGLRGGDWTSTAFHLAAPTRLLDFGPSFESDEIGFRVVMVPETALNVPLLATVGLLALRTQRRNFRLPASSSMG